MNKELISRGVVEIINTKDFEQKIDSGKKLRIKLGVDPSSPDIHLGHAVALWQLKKFQDAGHTVIFLIGDYTALIGDPSGKNKTRPILSDQEIKANAKTYMDQVGKILDMNKIEIRKNSEWFSKMSLQDIIRLGSRFSVANIIERDDFEKRLKSNQEISMHELFYPMMQAYDSVMLEADIEMGGTDQKFNLLAGRELQRKMGQPAQAVVITELLVGLDGREKMSKSLGNYIGVNENPNSQYGKTMSIKDEMIIKYFQLCTHFPNEQISEYALQLKDGMNPRDIKAKLAHEIVSIYHGKTEADKAEQDFIAQFKNKEIPDDIIELKLEGNFPASLLLINLSAASSNSDARRLIKQGGMKIDGTKITEEDAVVSTHPGMIVQVGKRRFWKIK